MADRRRGGHREAQRQKGDALPLVIGCEGAKGKNAEALAFDSCAIGTYVVSPITEQAHKFVHARCIDERRSGAVALSIPFAVSHVTGIAR